MKKWAPKDVIALVVVGGAIYLLANGINSFVGWSLVGIVGAYYGIDLTPFIKLGRNHGKKEEK